MPYLADDDPIVLLANHINDVLPDGESSAVVVAALASSLGALLDIAIEDNVAPPSFLVLRELLMRAVCEIVSARADMMTLRES